MRPYQFINGPWEYSELPTIVKDDPAGGDPHILAVLKRIHNPEELYDLCRLANDSVEIAHETGLTPRQLAERCEELVAALEKAAGWFEQYADLHYAKARTAPDGREQHGREVKAKANADRAKELRAAIAKAEGGEV